jgi:acyl carrier protein
MSQAEVSERLLAFIRERFLDDDPASGLDGNTPLLEWGILNSMNTAILLNYMQSEFGCDVPVTSVNVQNFRNVNAMTQMLSGLGAEQEGIHRA